MSLRFMRFLLLLCIMMLLSLPAPTQRQTVQKTKAYSVYMKLPPYLQTRFSINSTHSGKITSILPHPVKPIFVSGGEDTAIKIWSHSGYLIKTLHEHQATIVYLAWRARDTQLLSVSADGEVNLWNLDGKLLQSTRTGIRFDAQTNVYQSAQAIHFVQYAHKPTPHLVRTVFAKDTLKNQEKIMLGRCHAEVPTQTHTLVRDHQYIAIYPDATACIWDQRGRLLQKISDIHTSVTDMHENTSRAAMTLLLENAAVKTVAIGATAPRKARTFFTSLHSVLKTKSYQNLSGQDRVAVLAENRLSIFDSQGAKINSFPGTFTGVRAFAMDVTRDLFFTGDTKGNIQIWHLGSGQKLHSIDYHLTPVSGVRLCHNGDRLFISSGKSLYEIGRHSTQRSQVLSAQSRILNFQIGSRCRSKFTQESPASVSRYETTVIKSKNGDKKQKVHRTIHIRYTYHLPKPLADYQIDREDKTIYFLDTHSNLYRVPLTKAEKIVGQHSTNRSEASETQNLDAIQYVTASDRISSGVTAYALAPKQDAILYATQNPDTVTLINYDKHNKAVSRKITFPGQPGSIQGIAWLTADKFIFFNSTNRLVFSDIAGTVLKVLDFSGLPIRLVRILSESFVLFDDGGTKFYLWDLKKNRLHTILAHDSWIKDLRVASDKKIISLGSDHVIKIWTVQDGAPQDYLAHAIFSNDEIFRYNSLGQFQASPILAGAVQVQSIHGFHNLEQFKDAYRLPLPSMRTKEEHNPPHVANISIFSGVKTLPLAVIANPARNIRTDKKSIQIWIQPIKIFPKNRILLRVNGKIQHETPNPKIKGKPPTPFFYYKGYKVYNLALETGLNEIQAIIENDKHHVSGFSPPVYIFRTR